MKALVNKAEDVWVYHDLKQGECCWWCYYLTKKSSLSDQPSTFTKKICSRPAALSSLWMEVLVQEAIQGLLAFISCKMLWLQPLWLSGGQCRWHSMFLQGIAHGDAISRSATWCGPVFILGINLLSVPYALAYSFHYYPLISRVVYYQKSDTYRITFSSFLALGIILITLPRVRPTSSIFSLGISWRYKTLIWIEGQWRGYFGAAGH